MFRNLHGYTSLVNFAVYTTDDAYAYAMLYMKKKWVRKMELDENLDN